MQEYLNKNSRYSMPKHASSQFLSGFEHDIDVSLELDQAWSSFYQSQVGILRWCVKLGQIDIITEVSILASQLALPREGHLEKLLHVLLILKRSIVPGWSTT